MSKDKKRILIIDDHPGLAEGYKDELQHRGFDVVAVHSTKQATPYLRQHFDAIVADHMLGAGDTRGADFLQELKQQRQPSKLVLLTGYDAQFWEMHLGKKFLSQNIDVIVKSGFKEVDKLVSLLKKDKVKREPSGPRKAGQIDLLAKKKKRRGRR